MKQLSRQYPSRLSLLPLFLFQLLFVLPSASGQVRINEVCSSNASVVADPEHGDFSDWIELHNPAGIAAGLGGYFLSDDTADIYKWQLPDELTLSAGEYLLVFADGRDYGLHASFNLNKMGEYVLLSNPTDGIVDSIRVPFLLNDMSYGRLPADPALLSVFETPTPSVANIGSTQKQIAPLPQFSKPGGFFDGPVKIGLSADSKGAGYNDGAKSGVQIFYTLDGSYPTTGANLYTDSIEITATTAVRAITIGEGMIPGIAATQTYFINEPRHLPVFSMVTNPEYLFSDETGIMVQGTNGTTGYCTDIPHNLAQDWERPVNLEFYEQGSQQVINQLCGTKIFGGCSRIRYPQKSLAFFARSEYEYSSFKYQLFPSKPADDYETFILRAGADDQPHTFFRDPLTHMLVQDQVDVDMQAYRPVVLYINGEYYGIINLREKINEHYVNDNFGIDADSVDLLKINGENSWNVVSGSNEDYIDMMDFVRGNDLSLPENYAYMTTRMDIDEYINYQVIQVYLGGRDWPGNNIKYWKSSVEPYTKWRWILFDLDHHFKEFFGNIMEESTEEDCGCSWPNPPWSTLLFRSMLENETFREKFIARFNLLSSTVFDRERMHAMVDRMQADLLPEMPRHIERWGGQKVTHIENTWMSPVFNSIEEWNARVQVMHEFIDSRHEVAMQQMHDYFGIVEAGTHHLAVSLADPSTSTLLVDNAPVVEGAFSGNFTYAAHLPVEVLPKAGYLFFHWDRISYVPVDSMVITLGDEWRYDDSGQWPDEAWKDPGFDDSGWKTGFAELGYGDGDETTVVSYGPDPDYKHITTRFRKTFNIDDLSVYRAWEMRYKRNDGISVYLNGTEIIRDNQNRYYVGNDTPAESAVAGDEENRLLVYNVNPALIVTGENTIAAEVHQVSRTSSDISFDLQLQATRLVPLDTQQTEEAKLEFELLQDLQLVAHVKTDTMWEKRLFINEIQTANIDKYADEAGDFDDWIELYNASSAPVDMGGLFLSDTLPATRPWMFPLNRPDLTLIAPDSFLVVFADNEPQEGPLHASFRLNDDGEQVVLLHITGNDTTILDHIVYGEQYNNVTYGRYPDGSEHFKFMPVNTPWMSNFWEPLETISVEDGTARVFLKVYPNPSGGRFFVSLEGVQGEDAVVSVYSISGMKVYEQPHLLQERIEVSLDGRPAGMYLLEIQVNGRRYVERIVVR
ncbi:MAG: CotH kinase family protein [Bacteroidales bacterium]|nr:CotH kinase family protein [Bacteroidales bacterium]MDT8431273.1 CotH kinase family protein [Bacteroidales bacterium]